MGDVLRIIDRFKITGHGVVYTVKISKGANVRMGDLLSDLRGNRFEVSGIEMFRRKIPEGKTFEDMPFGLMLKQIDGVDPFGNILVKNLKEINFIFCNHPLYQRKVDEDYEDEYQEAGLHHSCALFSYEDMESGKLSLFGEEISGLTIYRGWMMKPEMYSDFYKLLEQKGIYLINTPEEYERYHTLPGWHDDFAEETAQSVWETEGNIENILLKAKQLNGPYIVKDYVKSRKHEWYDACFIKNISDIANTTRVIRNFVERQGDSLVGGIVLRKFMDLHQIGFHERCFIKNISDIANTTRVIRNFVERQGDSLVGGIVLRKFMDLHQIGFHERCGMPISEEYRIFVYAGKILIMDNYWTEKEDVKLSDVEISWIECIAKKVRSNFVTIDIARKDDGELMIMEFGDGQVSGLQQIEAKDFYQSFEQEERILAKEFFSDGTAILIGDPMPDKSAEQMQLDIASISSTQELVDVYVQVHNKFWYIEDALYDYEEESEEYIRVKEIVEAWGEMMDLLDKKIMVAAKEEGLLAERQPNSGTVKQLESFMKKYGYKDGGGWWIKLE